MLKFYGYKKCSTCRKAETFLEKSRIAYEFIDITQSPPSKTDLKLIQQLSKVPPKKLFNTSGVVYREMNLKARVDSMSAEEIFSLLASNGKLIKRPLAFDGHHATVGFSEETYCSSWG